VREDVLPGQELEDWWQLLGLTECHPEQSWWEIYYH